MKVSLSHQYFLLFLSYLTDRYFQVVLVEGVSSIYRIYTGVPQGSVLGPTLYQLFTADIPNAADITIVTFAEDTAFLCSHENPDQAVNNLQTMLNSFQSWLNTWRVQVNEAKYTYITFTLRPIVPTPVTLNNIPIPSKDGVKYLTFEKKLTWKKHIVAKRKELECKLRRYYWSLGIQLAIISAKQSSIVQGSTDNGMELWHPPLGLREDF